MKRIFVVILVLVFSFLTAAVRSYAVDNMMKMDTINASGSPTPSVMQKNDYRLAYPGMLPDNPLYTLKVLRDRIISFLITDPQKKTEYFLLQADKQIAMVPELVDKKEIILAKAIALKGENNMTELTFVYKNYGTKPDEKMYKKLQNASAKHQEVLINVLKKVNENEKKVFQQVINFSKTNQEEITRIYSSM